MRQPNRHFSISLGLLVLLVGTIGPGILGASGADLAKGEKIYKLMCVKCHGPTGRGDGRKAADLEKKPADYTDRAKMAKFTDEDLKKAVKEGKKPMPDFGKKLTDEQIDNVIAYIRTFAGAHAGK